MISLFKRDVFVLFLLAPLVKPNYISTLQSINIIFNIWLFISFFSIIIFYLSCKRISSAILLLIVFNLVIVINTIINHGHFIAALSMAVSIISICMLVELCVNVDSRVFIRCALFYTTVIACVNLVSVLVQPDGLYVYEFTNAPYWFLGHRNLFAPVLFPMITFSLLHSYDTINKINIRTYALLFVSLLTFVTVWSVGSIIGIFLILFFVIFIYNRNYSKILNFKLYFIIYIILSILIVFMRIQNSLGSIIENVFSKDATFSTRTVLWDNIIRRVAENPFGYGVEHPYDSAHNLGGSFHYLHAHNELLDITYIGGVVALILYITILVKVGMKLMKYKEHALTSILSFSLFSFFIMFINEAHRSRPLYFAILILSLNIDKIINQYNYNKQESLIAKTTIKQGD